MLKAAREAKQRTSWISPDERYERTLREFVGELLADTPNNAFLADLREQAAFSVVRCAEQSRRVDPALHLARAARPVSGGRAFRLQPGRSGQPAPVDYGLRARLLEEMEAQVAAVGAQEAAGMLAQNPCDPRTKLFVIRQLLAMRTRLPELLRDGDYRPLEVVGTRSRHAVAFARRSGKAMMIVVVGRLFAGLLGAGGRLPVGDIWEDTELRLGELAGVRGEFTDALTGASVRVDDGLKLAAVLRHLPGAVLVGEG